MEMRLILGSDSVKEVVIPKGIICLADILETSRSDDSHSLKRNSYFLQLIILLGIEVMIMLLILCMGESIHASERWIHPCVVK